MANHLFDHFGREVGGGIVLRQSLFFFVENNELNVYSAKLGELHGLLDKALLSLIVSDVPRV